jgi:hypothetical protein
MKSTSQLLATILISLALVNAAPLPSPQFSGLIDAVGPLEQKYCAPGKNFKDPICPEYAGVKGAMAKQRRTFDSSNPSSVVPDTSGFPNPAGPLFGEVGSVGSLLSGSGPSKDSPFPTLTGESASVLDGTSGPAGKPASRRQLSPAAAGGVLTTAESLLGGNAAVALKREPTSPSLNDLSGLSALGPALGGKAAVPSNGAFDFGTLPKRQVDQVLGALSPPSQEKRQTVPGLSGVLGGVPGVGSVASSLAPQPAAAQKRQVSDITPVPVAQGINGAIVGIIPLSAHAPAQKRQDTSALPLVGSLLGPKPAARQLPAVSGSALQGIPIVGPLVGSLGTGLTGLTPAPAAAAA